MPPINKKKEEFRNPVAETVQATGNFLNSVQNPIFIVLLLLMIGGGYISYAAVHIIADSIDKISLKMNVLSGLLLDQKVQNADEIKMLQFIMEDIKRCHATRRRDD